MIQRSSHYELLMRMLTSTITIHQVSDSCLFLADIDVASTSAEGRWERTSRRCSGLSAKVLSYLSTYKSLFPLNYLLSYSKSLSLVTVGCRLTVYYIGFKACSATPNNLQYFCCGSQIDRQAYSFYVLRQKPIYHYVLLQIRFD